MMRWNELPKYKQRAAREAWNIIKAYVGLAGMAIIIILMMSSPWWMR